MINYRYLFLLVIIAGTGCKERFDIPVNSSSQSLLVVEGVINSGTGPTQIRISRSVRLDRAAQDVPELGAQVKVEGSDSTSYVLAETTNGIYVSPQLSLASGRLYRLRIHTSAGREYLSDFVPVKQTPDIDSVSWKLVNGDLVIYANTHDAQDKTRYYRWDYTETWEIRSGYYSVLKLVNGVIVPRSLPAEDVSVCWKYNTSSNIILGSSARLQSDVISEAPLLEIPHASEKLGVRYSVIVRQYALTKEGYDFYQMMKKNTESLGTIFDPQPSEVRGNIKSVSDPVERVIGWISVSDTREKRIFITSSQLPGWGFALHCSDFFVDNNPDSIRKYIPAYYPYSQTFTGYYVSTPPCVDCTVRGGNNSKPAYW